jgi:hypothetical protein
VKAKVNSGEGNEDKKIGDEQLRPVAQSSKDIDRARHNTAEHL